MESKRSSSTFFVRRQSSSAIAPSEQSSPLSDCINSFPSPPAHVESAASRVHGQSISCPALKTNEGNSTLSGNSPTGGTGGEPLSDFEAYNPTQQREAPASTYVTREELNWLPYVDQPSPEGFVLEGDPKVADQLECSTTPFEDFQSPNTDCTAVSTDGFYDDIDTPTCIGTPKFTNKWPRPVTLKYIDGENVMAQKKKLHTPLIGTPVETVEEGQRLGGGFVSVGKWAPAKIWLVSSVMMVFVYGTALLILASMTWFNAWPNAGVMTVADYDILVVITLSASFLVATAMLGISGTFLDSRPILAVYTLLLWPNLILILSVGYISYKRVTFNLDRKLNLAWTRFWSVPGKQIIQDSLHCCGFYNTMHDPSPSKRCYLRSPLPGCRNALFDFEQKQLNVLYKVAFAMAALHLANLVIGLLASNHVTRRFGKGLTPRGYRLNREDVRKEAENILSGGGVSEKEQLKRQQ